MTEDVDRLNRMKVFVSYSRDDVAFADQLVIGLEDRGFDPILDRHDIDAAENWRQRLGSLILSCDAVVFVLTERSAGSSICAWEVEEAQRLGKRILPVAPREFAATPPQALADLNWIHFYPTAALPGSGVLDGMRKLVRALKVDLGWLREQTRLSEQAELWRVRGQRGVQSPADSSLLLRGQALEDALAWARQTPASAHVPPLVSQYLEASSGNEVRIKAEAQAGLAEREEALKKAEIAVEANTKTQARMKQQSRIALAAGFILSAVASVGGWLALANYADANEKRAALYAQAADLLNSNGEQEKAMLMALYGDPAAQTNWIDPILKPGGFDAPRLSLVRGYTHSRLAAAPETGFQRLRNAVLFPDGKHIVVASGWNPVKVISTDGTDPVEFAYEDGAAQTLAVSPDGKLIAVVYGDDIVRILPAGGGAVVATIKPDHTFQSIAFSSDGKQIALGAYDLTQIWTADGAQMLREIEAGATVLAFTPDGKRLVTGGEKLMSWPLDGGMADQYQLQEEVGWLTVSGDSKFIAATRIDGAVAVFRTYDTTKANADGSFAIPAVGFHNGIHKAAGVAISPDGQTLLAAYQDGGAALWQADTGAELPLLKLGVGQRGINVQFSSDGKLAMTATEQGIKLWRIDTEKSQASRPYSGLPEGFREGGQKLLTKSNDGLAIWPVGGGDPITIPLNLKEVKVALSQDGTRIVTGGNDGIGRVWSVTGEKLHETEIIPPGPGAWIQDVDLSADGRTAVFALWDQRRAEYNGAALWRLGESKPFAAFTDENSVSAVGASADGARFVVASAKFDPKLLDSEGKQIARLQGHGFTGVTFRVTDITFSPNGTLVATAAVPETFATNDYYSAQVSSVVDGHSVGRLAVQGEGFDAVAFSADSRFVVTSSGPRLRIWSVKGGDPLQTIVQADSNWQPRVSFAAKDTAVVSTTGGQVGGRGDGKSGQKEIRTYSLDPILLAKVGDQVRLACARLKEVGVMEFSEADYQRFPILDRNAPNPCAKVWGFDPRAKATAELKVPSN